MRRITSLIIAVCFLLPLTACGTPSATAEPAPTPAIMEEFQLVDEWYGAGIYENDYLPAELDDDGSFHVLANAGEWIYAGDGSIHDPWDDYAGRRVQLSDDVILFYVTDDIDGAEDDYLYGGLILAQADGYICYEFAGRSVLFTEDMILPHDGGNPVEYQLSGNTIYIINETTYIRGDMEWYGSDVLLCPLDEDPVTELGYDMGVPMYIFIRSSIKE